MGFFSDIKKTLDSARETDISKMDFARCDGFAGALVQRFADQSIPVCPMCGGNPHWLLHVAQKTVKIFPLTVEDHYYHLKCDSCGLILHTVFQTTGDQKVPFLYNPSPRDNMTMMTFDVVGNRAEDFSMAGKEMSIWEINQLAESKKR